MATTAFQSSGAAAAIFRAADPERGATCITCGAPIEDDELWCSDPCEGRTMDEVKADPIDTREEERGEV